MTRKLVLLSGTFLLVVWILGVFSRSNQYNAYATATLDASTKQHILSATVRIVFYAPLLDENDQPQIVMANEKKEVQYVTFKKKEGLGTLVNLNGEAVIVTHDHWTLLDRLKMARFYDSSGDLLAEVGGDDFNRLIRFRDGGTMVLAFPAQLVATAVIGNAQMVQPEDVVFLAYRTPNSGRLDVVAMKVTDVCEYDGHDVFALVSLYGEVVDHGNSGGGVWCQGKLVANMWSTIQKLFISKEGGNTLNRTDRSMAALFPDDAIP
jgi:hypothetical protein